MKKRRKALKVYAVVASIMALSLLVIVSCDRSQPASSPGVSEDGNASHEAELPVLGEAFDFELTNQDGTRITLAELRGKVVLMNFIYTSCPTACQLENFDLKSVWDSLDEDSRRALVIVSMSFDHEVETTQVLKECAQAWGVDVPGW